MTTIIKKERERKKTNWKGTIYMDPYVHSCEFVCTRSGLASSLQLEIFWKLSDETVCLGIAFPKKPPFFPSCCCFSPVCGDVIKLYVPHCPEGENKKHQCAYRRQPVSAVAPAFGFQNGVKFCKRKHCVRVSETLTHDYRWHKFQFIGK